MIKTKLDPPPFPSEKCNKTINYSTLKPVIRGHIEDKDKVAL